tara:strand:+ start:58 stop:309 length:252 start_codon:yes stop_codon:yes gene_type:complete
MFPFENDKKYFDILKRDIDSEICNIFKKSYKHSYTLEDIACELGIEEKYAKYLLKIREQNKCSFYDYGLYWYENGEWNWKEKK